MARPRPSRRDRVADPDDVSDVRPAELRRLQKEFFSRVDHLAAAFQRKRDEALARRASAAGRSALDRRGLRLGRHRSAKLRASLR